MTDQEINEAVARKLGLELCIKVGRVRDYCHDIKAAFECFEKMAGTDEPFGLFEPYLIRDKLGDSTWVCGLKSSCGWVVRETADTAPMAICLAFLKLP